MNRQRIGAARLWAAMRFPYMASALFASRIIEVPGLKTMAVDEHWRLYVDPELVEQWTAQQLGSLLVHHAGHLIRDHSTRARALGVDRETEADWALAADAEINDDLSGSELDVPGEFVLPQALGCEPGRLAEEYFEKIATHRKACPECGSGAHGQHRDWEEQGPGAIDPSSAHLIRCQVASELLKCCRDGLYPGKLPMGLIRWAEALLEPKVDWRHVLAAEIRRGIANVAGRVDYTYQRPSRRASISKEVILPALRRPVPEVAVVCDTSGSMSELMLAEVLAEVEGILRSVGMQRNRLRVLSVDAAVHTVKRVSSAKQVELFGGGGTNMGEGIRAAAELKPKPSVVVILTDGFTPWPSEPPKGVHVIVGLIGLGTWPVPGWAKVVRVDEAA